MQVHVQFQPFIAALKRAAKVGEPSTSGKNERFSCIMVQWVAGNSKRWGYLRVGGSKVLSYAQHIQARTADVAATDNQRFYFFNEVASQLGGFKGVKFLRLVFDRDAAQLSVFAADANDDGEITDVSDTPLLVVPLQQKLIHAPVTYVDAPEDADMWESVDTTDYSIVERSIRWLALPDAAPLQWAFEHGPKIVSAGYSKANLPHVAAVTRLLVRDLRLHSIFPMLADYSGRALRIVQTDGRCIVDTIIPVVRGGTAEADIDVAGQLGFEYSDLLDVLTGDVVYLTASAASATAELLDPGKPIRLRVQPYKKIDDSVAANKLITIGGFSLLHTPGDISGLYGQDDAMLQHVYENIDMQAVFVGNFSVTSTKQSKAAFTQLKTAASRLAGLRGAALHGTLVQVADGHFWLSSDPEQDSLSESDKVVLANNDYAVDVHCYVESDRIAAVFAALLKLGAEHVSLYQTDSYLIFADDQNVRIIVPVLK